MEDLFVTKRCSTCRLYQPVSFFSPSKWSRDGLHNQCAVCGKAYRQANKEKIKERNRAKYEAVQADAEKHAAYLERVKHNAQKAREANLEKVRAYHREATRKRRTEERAADPAAYQLKQLSANQAQYRKRLFADPDFLARRAEANNKRYHRLREHVGVVTLSAERKARYQLFKNRNPEAVKQKNKERNRRRLEQSGEELRAYHRLYKARKSATDPNFKLAKAMRRMVHALVKGQGGLSLLPYTPASLRAHMELQWRDSMSWENWGTLWQIDHIKPIVAFLHEGQTDPAIVNALTNLQPLTVEENQRKGDTYNAKAS